jgi:hypothetical protein
MQNQGVHKGDTNPPPLEPIEEARENDEGTRQGFHEKGRALEGAHWQNNVNVLPSNTTPIALPAAEPQDVKVTNSNGETFKYE